MLSHKHAEKNDQKEGEKGLLEKLGETQKELNEQKQKTDDFKDIAQRVQAEFENFAKRTEKEKKEFREIAQAKLIEEILPVLDSLDGAIESMKKHGKTEKDEGLQGLVLLHRQLFGVLEKHGLKKIEAEGKKFDPQLHECYASESIDGIEDEIVIGEIQKGYLLNSRVLRASKVRINKVLHEKKSDEGVEKNE